MKREFVEDKYKWDLSSYYATQKDFDDDFEFVKNNYEKICSFENKLNEEKAIFDCLDFESILSQKLGKLYVYASLRTKEDLTNTQCEEQLEYISALSVKISAATSFMSVELANLSDEFLLKLKLSPRAKNYDIIFDDIIKFKAHTLSKSEEKLLSLMGEFSGGFSEVFDKFENADVCFEDAVDTNGKKYKLTLSTYGIYLESPDAQLRKSAIQNVNKAFGKYNQTISANYINHVKQNCFAAKIRNFNSALEASLFGEDVDRNVYVNLVDSVNKNLFVAKKYFELKRQLLNLDKMGVWDVSAPTSSKFNLCLTFEEAVELVKKSLAPLGNEYVANYLTAIKQKWVDVMPNDNKDSGAFSWGAYGALPVVLLNYEKTTNDVFTIAHEFGHCMHTLYSNNNQPYEKAGYEIFVAEVASIVNEMLLLRYQLKNAKSDEEKLYYYDYLLKMFKSTILRQTMFAEFEKFAHETHEKAIPLTAELLNNYYYELNRKYFGDKVDLLDELKFEWSRIPHFYNDFYVYKYSTGMISAIVLSEKLFNNEKNARENYLKFLSSGASASPVELLKMAGADLNKIETFDYAFSVLNEFVEEYEKVVKQ